MTKVWDPVRREWTKKPKKSAVREAPQLPRPMDPLALLQTREHNLLPRERAILFARLGIDQIKIYTHPELAAKYQISRHRVSQIEKRAEEKLGVEILRPAGQSRVIGVRIDGHDMDDFEFALRCIAGVLYSDPTIDNGSYI